jgi:preprotein translocase subunit SecG
LYVEIILDKIAARVFIQYFKRLLAMEQFILIIHSLAALVIVGLVLLQQGKGAAAGASFGSGASQTVFGSEGSTSFFTKATWFIATLFFCTSFGLAVIAKNKSEVNSEAAPIQIQQEIPAAEKAPVSEIPTSDVPAAQTNTVTEIPTVSADVSAAVKVEETVPAVPEAKKE